MMNFWKFMREEKIIFVPVSMYPLIKIPINLSIWGVIGWESSRTEPWLKAATKKDDLFTWNIFRIIKQNYLLKNHSLGKKFRAYSLVLQYPTLLSLW